MVCVGEGRDDVICVVGREGCDMKEDTGSVAGIIIYVAAWKGLFQILFIGEEVGLSPDSNIYVELTQWIIKAAVFE